MCVYVNRCVCGFYACCQECSRRCCCVYIDVCMFHVYIGAYLINFFGCDVRNSVAYTACRCECVRVHTDVCVYTYKKIYLYICTLARQRQCRLYYACTHTQHIQMCVSICTWRCMCIVCIYRCILIYIYIYIYIGATSKTDSVTYSAHTHTRNTLHFCVRVYVYTYAKQVLEHSHRYSCTHQILRTRSVSLSPTHTYTHTQTHTHTNINIHMRAGIHTFA